MAGSIRPPGNTALLKLLFAAASLLTPLNPAVPLPTGDGLPAKAPSAVGMSAARLANIDRVIERGIRAGGYPGAAVVVGRKGAAVWEKGFGRLGWTSDAGSVVPPSARSTISRRSRRWSATTTAIMILYDEGKIRLDDRVIRVHPRIRRWREGQRHAPHAARASLGAACGSRPLAAGLDARRGTRGGDLDSALRVHPATASNTPTSAPTMLGFVVEAVSGEKLDRFLDDARLRSARDVGHALPARCDRFADASRRRSSTRRAAIRSAARCTTRTPTHSAAWPATRGCSAPRADLAVFAQMMLNGGAATTARASSPTRPSRCSPSRAAGTRALGWDTCGGKGSCGEYLSSTAYGHTGFTGTSLWIDPEREMFVVLLTNRVHAARARRPAKVIADVRADLADAAALAVTDYADGPMRACPRRSAPTARWAGTVRSRTRRSSARRRRQERRQQVKTATRGRPRRRPRRASKSGAAATGQEAGVDEVGHGDWLRTGSPSPM